MYVCMSSTPSACGLQKICLELEASRAREPRKQFFFCFFCFALLLVDVIFIRAHRDHATGIQAAYQL